MFRNIDYKKKNKMLFLALLLAVLIVYNMAISNSVAVYKEVKEIEQKNQQLKNAPKEIDRLTNEIKGMEALLNISSTNDELSQDKLLEVLSKFSQTTPIVIRSLPERFTIKKQHFSIETAILNIEGRYVDILKLMYLFEQKKRYGRLASVQFSAKKDLKTKKKTLTAVIYFQLIKKDSYE